MQAMLLIVRIQPRNKATSNEENEKGVEVEL